MSQQQQQQSANHDVASRQSRYLTLVPNGEEHEPETKSRNETRAQKKERKRREADERKARYDTENPYMAAERERRAKLLAAGVRFPKFGELTRRRGVLGTTCNGRYGHCGAFVPLNELRVPIKLGYITRKLRERLDGQHVTFEDITRESLAMIGFCREDADKALPNGHQSVAEALNARDQLLRDREDRKRDRQQLLERREKVFDRKLLELSGQTGGKKRPAAYLAKKAQKAADSISTRKKMRGPQLSDDSKQKKGKGKKK